MDDFYRVVQPEELGQEERLVQGQAFAGMLWSKQLYYYDVEQWLRGDPGFPAPPQSRLEGRNHDWGHLNNIDILSMPDKWEYPWLAAWDLAFHCIPLVLVDPDFAKRQLELMLRVWYIHPNEQLPVYEWAFGDVNPPVHAWAAWRVYQMDAEGTGSLIALFWNGSFTSCCLTSPGGSIAKMRTVVTYFKVVSWAWTLSVSSIAAPCCPQGDTSTSPTAQPGWDFSAGK